MIKHKESGALFPFGSCKSEAKAISKPSVKSGWVYMDNCVKDNLPKGWDHDNVSTQIGILWALNYDFLSKRMKIVDLKDSTLLQRIELLKFINRLLGLESAPYPTKEEILREKTEEEES